MDWKISVQSIGIIATLVISVANFIYSFLNSKKTLFVNTITSQRVKWMGELREQVSEYISLVSLYDDKYISQVGSERGTYLDTVTKLAAKIKLHLNYKGEKDIEIMGLVEALKSDTMALYYTVNLSQKNTEEKIMYLGDEFQNTLQTNLNAYISSHDVDFSGQNMLDILHKAFTVAWNQTATEFTQEFLKNAVSLRERLQTNTEQLTSKTQEYLKDEWNRVKDEANQGDLSKSGMKPILSHIGVVLYTLLLCVLIIIRS